MSVIETGNGTVYLVGAGPGDPGLLTIKGRDCLERADVVVYDSLVNPVLLGYAPSHAEKLPVGKRGHRESSTQSDINALLIDRAMSGLCVVRLKGGDPFMFGRGGEEAIALREAGIPFEVVPGVSAAIAVPAYAGIPLTHRGVSSSVAIATGHEDPSKGNSDVDWRGLAASAGTLVLMMGADNVHSLADRLIACGRAPGTPVAIIRWGTYPFQQTWTGTLATIGTDAETQRVESPAIIVVGPVASLRERVRWFDHSPLFGKRVLVTRPPEGASALSAALSAERAIPISVPVVATDPAPSSILDEALDLVPHVAWVLFTSARGVDVIVRRAQQTARFDVLKSAAVGAVGAATAHAAKSAGLQVAFVPAKSNGRALGEELPDVLGQCVLLLQAASARPDLRVALERRGARVTAVAVYETLPAPAIPNSIKAAIRDGAFDCVTFTSGSTVDVLVAALRGVGDADPAELLNRATIACIGPVTAEAASRHGLRVDVVAEEQSIRGLVQALRDHLSQDSRSL